MSAKRSINAIIGLSATLLAAALFAIVTGPAEIPISDALTAIFGKAPVTTETIVLAVRLPRIILAGMVGASLGLAGVIFQAMFRNPLADPYLIGISSGAALGATLAISFGASTIGIFSPIPVFAFMGALMSIYLAYRFARLGSLMSVSSLLLAGIAIGSFCNAVISVLMVYSKHDLQTIIFWLMGGFSARNWNHVLMALPWFMISPTLMFFARDLNIILLGEEKAQNLGVDIEWTKKILLALASLIAAAAVSVSGIIGFIGLIVPHIVRIIVGPDHRLLIPATVLSGASALILADTAARTFFGSMELPVGIVTAAIGAPFFVYLLRTRKQVYF